MYLGLFVLFIWRSLCAWKCCGKWMQHANYCSLLLGLMFVIMAYDAYYFITTALSDVGKSSWGFMPPWLQPFVVIAPGFCLACYALTSLQTFQHVERIKEESAVHRHDRAVQIILLPAVYATMAFSSLTRIYVTLGSHAHPYSHSNHDGLNRALSRSQTCFWVGDLYEAWALYQFGKLTLEVIKSAIDEQTNDPSEQTAASARGAMASHAAVESLAWLGILSFLLVCVAEAGISLFLLTFDSEASHATWNSFMNQFTLAGFLASCAAIYNVYIVETRFHRFLEGYSPMLKFVTVKILVTFAFVQRGFFKGIQILGNLLPKHARAWIEHIPFLGDFVDFEPAQFELFYASLIIVECFLVSILHFWAWGAEETWYDELGVVDERDVETSEVLAVSVQPSYGTQKNA